MVLGLHLEHLVDVTDKLLGINQGKHHSPFGYPLSSLKSSSSRSGSYELSLLMRSFTFISCPSLPDEVPVLVFVFVPLAGMGVEHVCVFLFLDELPE